MSCITRPWPACFFVRPAAMGCSLKCGVLFVPQAQLSSEVSTGLEGTGGAGAQHHPWHRYATCVLRHRLTDLEAGMAAWDGYKLREIGFEFRVISGEDSYSIFPAGPVSGKAEGRDSEFLFMWRDGPPAQQQPVRLEVEVRAVTPDNRHGPAARTVITRRRAHSIRRPAMLTSGRR